MADQSTREYILYDNNSFAVTEAIKATRTNLMFTAPKETHPIISFTSPYIGEGKSTTCANIALSFAESGFKTLIIDADMRKPTINKYFKAKSSPGLSDLLGGLVEENAIHFTSHKNLYLLPSGTIPPNPSELLTSERMSILLKELQSTFDYIFIDTPPVLMVTDAITLSSKVTGTIITVKQNYSRTNEVKEAMEMFAKVNGKVLGFIFTNYNPESKKGRYQYGYYDTGYAPYQYGKKKQQVDD